jgi:hypothetical protein
LSPAGNNNGLSPNATGQDGSPTKDGSANQNASVKFGETRHHKQQLEHQAVTNDNNWSQFALFLNRTLVVIFCVIGIVFSIFFSIVFRPV